jgi:dTDP-glucose 4,6-dehydratase
MITRCSNNYGPYQNIEKLIPLAITNLIQGRKVPLYGNGKNIREWIHVFDHVRAIAFLMAKGESGQTYNIGTGNDFKNIDLVNIILDKFGLNEKYVEFVPDRPGHDLRYSIDTRKITDLGFKPIINFDYGIIETISWYKQNVSWWKTSKN